MNKPTQETVCPKCGKPITTPQKSYCASCGARIFRSMKGESTIDPYLGQVIDNTFEVESVLGTGSMGIVYKARHRALDCHVALKILKHDLLSDRVVLARFQREAQAASKLSHPNVIRILHYGKTSLQAPYIAMECLEGMELGVLIPKEYPLDQRRVCSIALQTARALSAAHAANIVHRDLKPANIFVIQRSGLELVKVLDFGIAKVSDIEGEGLTREGAMCGTPAFMSPEQVIGKQVTYASDLFSLGSVMYYMLTNRLPFQGDNMVDMARAILTDTPIPPSKARFDHYIDPHLDTICMKALEKDVSKRYQTALEMVADLESAYNEIPTNSAAPKPKLVVVGDGSKVDPTGATQCMLPAYPDEEEDPALNGGTIVEIPVMSENNSEVMDTTKSGIVGALDAFGQAVSEVFGRQQEEHKLAPTDKTVINTKSMSDSDLEDPEEAREQLLQHRKRLMLGMVCSISILCVLVIVIMAIVSAMKTETPQEESPSGIAEDTATDETDKSGDNSDTPKDTQEAETDTVTAQPAENAAPEMDASQIDRLSELSKERSQTGLITGLAIGIGYDT
ncbi:MAG: protein kinase, partial [Proteobacteria bacterium]|nr:protein kinase [Pseudomonadota bacterium]